jgi:CheY-like chemotaxis protein
MKLNDIVESIPSIVSSSYDSIILIDDLESVFYTIGYNGEKIKVSIKKNITELNTVINNDKIIKLIEENKDIKEYIDTTYVVISSHDNYRVVLLSNIINNTISEDKPLLLIADDSPVITKFFVKTFKDDFDVLVAKDGEEAIDLVEKNKDRLMGAFFDLQMPKKNGYDVLNYFTEHDLFKLIPVSIISGEDSKDGIDKATSIDGVVDMVQKPFSKEAAKTIVDKTISFSPKYKEF